MSLIRQFRKNEELIEVLQDTAERIKEQEKTIKELREKLLDEKDTLKDEVAADYRELEKTKEKYAEAYWRTPFHMTDDEYKDYLRFTKIHETPDKGSRCFTAAGVQDIIFYYHMSMYGRSIIVECPACGAKMELGKKSKD